MRVFIDVREKEDPAGAPLLVPGLVLRECALLDPFKDGLPLLESQILILKEVENPVSDLPLSTTDQVLAVHEPVVQVDLGSIVETVVSKREEGRAVTAGDPLNHLAGDEPAIEDQDRIREVQAGHGRQERRDVLHRAHRAGKRAQHRRHTGFQPGEESKVHLGKGDLFGIVPPLCEGEVLEREKTKERS